MAFSIRRLRTHATIALAIFVTLYSGWSLTEATLAYLGELVILVLVVYARVLAAKRLPGGQTGWRLVGGKALAIAVTAPLYAFIVLLVLMLVFGTTVPLLLAGCAIAGAQPYGTTIVPWFFVGTLALMAIVDAATYIYELDAVAAVSRGAASQPA